ncbi:MAG: DUF2948 family protein [Rhizobiaceae bacterium]
MSELKLVALDEEDLKIISAHVQDAVLKVGDMSYDAKGQHFVMAMNRFAWEVKPRWFRRRHERRRSLVHFARVLSVKSAGIDLARKEDVLSLLAIRFNATDAPAGIVEIDFSGGSTIRLEVECIEGRLSDLGAAWETRARPVHQV